jgi:hypothetical protein
MPIVLEQQRRETRRMARWGSALIGLAVVLIAGGAALASIRANDVRILAIRPGFGFGGGTASCLGREVGPGRIRRDFYQKLGVISVLYEKDVPYQ